MAVLVAPNVVRFTLSGTNGATTWANVLDYFVTDDGIGDRSDAIASAVDRIHDAWVARIKPLVCDDSALTQITWVDLDSDLGETGGIGVTDAVGSDPTPPTTAQVSVLIRKNTPGGRASRPGRWYLTGIPEAGVNITALDNGYQTALQTAVDQFLDDTTLTGPLEDERQMCVVHTRNEGTPSAPDIVFVGSSVVTSLTVDGTAATQRRRLRR